MSTAELRLQGILLADRYRIGPLLGAGGSAVVHRATDTSLEREVAVKVMVRSGADPAELQREQAELQLLARHDHRALVTLFDAGTATVDGVGIAFLVMELVEGPTLAARLAEGPLPNDEVVRLGHDLADALGHVHADGSVHRDVKPANVLLARIALPGHEFDAKLTDFGIAAAAGVTRATATGTIVGTAAYLSPEQAAGERVHPSSDIYSLGLVLLESLTGEREYPGTLLESLSARMARDPIVPERLGPDWGALLTAMTARDPDARPSARTVARRLTEPMVAAAPAEGSTAPAVLTGSVTTAMPATAAIATGIGSGTIAAPARRRRRPLLIAGAVTSGVVAIAGATLITLQLTAGGPAPEIPTVVGPDGTPTPEAPEAELPAIDPAPTGETADLGDDPAPAPTPSQTPTPTPEPSEAPDPEPEPSPSTSEPAPSGEPAPEPTGTAPAEPPQTTPPAEPAPTPPTEEL